MKIAVQYTLIPGDTAADKAEWSADHGVDAIELNLWGFDGFDALDEAADTIVETMPVCGVCGNCDADFALCFDFLHPDLDKRRAAIDGSKRLLDLCGRVGAVGQVVPPIFGDAVVPDLSPVMSVEQLEDALMVAALHELGPYAAERGTRFLLEPLNRYEQHYLKRLADGVRVLEAADAPGCGLLADLFHMHIEERDSPRALRDAAAHVVHVHVADNTRHEPGTGDIDFPAAIAALNGIGYDGYLSYECSVSEPDPAANLAASVAWLRGLL